MQNNLPLVSELMQILHWKKSKSFYANKLGISEKEVEELIKEIRSRKDVEVNNYISALEEVVVKVNNDRGTFESTVETDYEPKDDLELAKLHKINLDKYKISNYWTKQKSSGKFTSSVFATLRQPKDYTPEDFAKFLETYTPKEILIKNVKNEFGFFKAVDIEVSIADFHLAKKTLEGESIQHKKTQYLTTLYDLVDRVNSVFWINKIVFPISNDFFHTDNYQNQTTAGTPQDTLVEYNHEYEEGFDLLVTAISYLQEVAKEVEVILVQGNHDRTKSFYLAHALEVFFRNNEKICFQREHSTTKSVILGNTFIGYHHGNCKIDELPLLFATGKDSFDFGGAKYREVHTGDKHHYMAKEVKGVRIQQMPSLSGTDRWHADNNYVNNIRAGLVLIYDPNDGKIGEFESRI